MAHKSNPDRKRYTRRANDTEKRYTKRAGEGETDRERRGQREGGVGREGRGGGGRISPWPNFNMDGKKKLPSSLVTTYNP